MFLSGAKSHHFIMTAILVSALTLCWSAEAEPASRDITIKKGTSQPDGGAFCYAENNNIKDICAIFDYYNLAWWFSPQRGTRQIQRRISGKGLVVIANAPGYQRQTLRCKLVFASYIQLRPGGKDIFNCVEYGRPLGRRQA